MDREKVIKALECLKVGSYCECCDYKPYDDCIKRVATDAISLLKEQEALKPKKVTGYNPPMYTIYEYECEKCKSPMMNKQPFCMGCGQAVKWE